MPLGLILGLARSFRRKRTSSLDILTTKRVPRGLYKGKNCKPTGFHTRKGGYVIVQEKLPHYVVPDLTNFKPGDTPNTLTVPPAPGSRSAFANEKEALSLKPYVSQCPRETTSASTEAKESAK